MGFLAVHTIYSEVSVTMYNATYSQTSVHRIAIKICGSNILAPILTFQNDTLILIHLIYKTKKKLSVAHAPVFILLTIGGYKF